MQDYITSAITSDGAIRVVAATTAELCNRAREIHNPSPTALAALGRVLTAAAMMGSMEKSTENTVTLQFRGGGPVGNIIAAADGSGACRGSIDNPTADLPLNDKGKLDVGGAVGSDGYLCVVRDMGLKEPYIGKVPLISGEIAEDLTYYYANSEQIPTAVALGVLVDTDISVRAAGGFILQVLPGATNADIDRVEAAVKKLTSVTELLDGGKTPEDMVKLLLDGCEIEFFENTTPRYRCDCSRERVDRALISMGREELTAMIEEDGKAEITCRFCDRVYNYTKGELETLLQNAKR